MHKLTSTVKDLTMDELHLLSLNCHGFSVDTASYLRGILTDSNYDFDIILLQETWLSTANCSRLGDISDEFVYFHNSAIEDRLTAGILAGRPFGGTAILVRKNLSARVAVVETGSPRITAICLSNYDQPDLLICSVYMPYNDRSVQQLGEYDATVGCLQAIVDSHHGCLFVIGGDLNVSKLGYYPAEHAIHQFCTTNNLFWLDPSIDIIDFTYHNDANGHFSLIEHFMCSKPLVDNIQKNCNFGPW